MIKNLEELAHLLKILNEQGVYTFKWDGLEMLIDRKPSQIKIDQDGLPVPTQADLDQMVGLPVQGIDDPFLDYSVHKQNEDTEG